MKNSDGQPFHQDQQKLTISSHLKSSWTISKTMILTLTGHSDKKERIIEMFAPCKKM
jgi:hypothetical protein